MKALVLNAVCCVLMIGLWAGDAAAQATAQLSGRVTDESGAVLPGATVTVTQTDTGFTRTDVTDATGTYVMPNLPTGPYRLEVSLSGFRSHIQTGIVLQVGATPAVNVVLALGGLEESVTVDAAAPLVDVQSAGISDVVENERIAELPLQGRQVTDLIVLAGAAVQTDVATTRGMPGSVAISVAGGQSFGVAYSLDGAIHNNPYDNLNLPLPFPDALQEFRVGTAGLSADNGMLAGASVNAVTKSGTNRLSGNIFEFVRDRRFNAKEFFAQVGPGGEREDDGLLRNQFGGTLGGPLVRDRVFFFGGYQGTALRLRPASNIAFVPTPAVLAGDFTTIASAACNGGRAITLAAPFVNNRLDPALFSPPAVNVAARLPASTDPCGRITYSTTDDSDSGQAIGRIDAQLSANHSLFGRYMATFFKEAPAYAKSDNILTTTNPGLDNLTQSFAIGDTVVIRSNTVNALRLAVNGVAINRYNEPFFGPGDIGAKAYAYFPNEIVILVTGGFNISGATASAGVFDTTSYQVGDDLTMVRGRHQLGLGANVTYWRSDQRAHANTAGQWAFDGSSTGLGMADFFAGHLSLLQLGGPPGANMEQLYTGLYGDDTWRMSDRLTLNMGLRWEPFLGQSMRDGRIQIFSLENFRQGVTSTQFLNAPAGFLYPGDPGFPEGTSGQKKQWRNFSPRVGVAWDVRGDGTMAVRSSYSLAYDFPAGGYHQQNVTSPPFGNRTRVINPPGGFADPYAHLGGDPHPVVPGPNVTYPPFGQFGVIDPDVNSPRVQSWNVTAERQLGSVWQVAASYLGSYSDRLWGLKALNPGVFLGVGPCTLDGVALRVCSTNANLDRRRALYLVKPSEAQFIGALDLHTSVGSQAYRGLRLSARRRSVDGVSINGNYTWSNCIGTPATGGTMPQSSTGYLMPDNPDFDRGHCIQNRTHLASFTAGYVTPQLAHRMLRAIASDWRLSGILSARSGSTLNIVSGRDNNFSGILNQRPDQISDDVYGAKTLDNYLNAAAFAQPAPGALGNTRYNSVQGPGFWEINLALSRLVRFTDIRTLELRIEAFNLLNNFNWGDPVTNFNSGAFGRITTQAGAPRIMQFGIKYGF
jgi:hypothetical protein